MNYSPLRYPGGKNKIAKFVKLFITKTKNYDTVYVEPFAGGAGVALSLLMSNSVESIVINDYDKAIYSIWRAIKEDSDNFIDLIRETPVTIEEWYKQKEVYENKNSSYSLELAFASFFLNRTNRSGILKAGPIGGYNQTGNYLIDVRFNKDELINRVQNIASKKNRIFVYNQDVRVFLKKYLPKYDNVFVYLDPPYYNKGKELYKNFFSDKDHLEIANLVSQLNCHWMVTYDVEDAIIKLYKNYSQKKFDLYYSAAKKIIKSEIMVVSDDSLWPTTEELSRNKININLRKEG